MTPEEQAAVEWYAGGTTAETVLECPVCGAGVVRTGGAPLRHRQWHERRGEQ